MFESIFGVQLSQYGRVILALGLVLALIMITVWLMRRFGSGGLSTGAGGRNRQQRLSVLDSAPVDARRRLVLIRRDNLEHLLLIGGPTDVVVEANIVRGAMPSQNTSRIPAPGRSGVFDLSETEMQPDAPLIPSYNEPAYEEPVRPVTPPPAPPAPAPIPFRPVQEAPRPAAPMPAPAPAPAAAAPMPPMPPMPAPRPAPRAPEQPAYADMAKRLEEALRKPDVAPAPAAVQAPAPAPAPAPVPQAGPIPHSHRTAAAQEAMRAPEPRVFAPAQPGRTPPPVQRAPEPRTQEARPAPQPVQTPQQNSAADVFGNLEEEMASLLRPGGKTTQ